MATSVWKGHLTFGLVTIPVKLCRAARAEKVSFRQVARRNRDASASGTLSQLRRITGDGSLR